MGERWIALVVALGVSCGGGSKWTPAPLPKERPFGQWDKQEEDRWSVLACENLIDAHGDLRCEQLDRNTFGADVCAGSLSKLRFASPSFRGQLAFRQLVVDLAHARSCDEVTTSFQNATAIRYAPSTVLPVTNCVRSGGVVGPFQISPEEARARRGRNAVRFADVPSSLAEPIEVCGMNGELEWLTRVACSNGTLPFGNDGDRARSTRVGPKGAPLHRCPGEEVILDVYKVPCPEQTYEVYMDMYECGPGEQF